MAIETWLLIASIILLLLDIGIVLLGTERELENPVPFVGENGDGDDA